MLSIFNLKHKTMENLKNLVLAASQKVEMNGVTDIKKLYPDSIVFDSIEEFEQHVPMKKIIHQELGCSQQLVIVKAIGYS